MRRLPKTALTKEDQAIIESRWYYRGVLGIHPLWYVQWQADIRDAELMLALAAGEMVKVDLDAMTLSFQWSYEGVPKLVVIRGNGSNITNFA
jgi:hypothetical protein